MTSTVRGTRADTLGLPAQRRSSHQVAADGGSLSRRRCGQAFRPSHSCRDDARAACRATADRERRHHRGASRYGSAALLTQWAARAIARRRDRNRRSARRLARDRRGGPGSKGASRPPSGSLGPGRRRRLGSRWSHCDRLERRRRPRRLVGAWHRVGRAPADLGDCAGATCRDHRGMRRG
jgi:hypothetical protein